MEYFTNLKIIRCWNCKLTNLDVSKNLKLEILYFANNNLETLDTSNNTALKDLDCGGNKMKELNLEKNKNLENLWCNVNNLNELDISNNKKLVMVTCSKNKLKALNLSSNSKLEEFYCDNNNLTDLNLSSNPKLKRLDCSNNNLTSLDLSNNNGIEYFKGEGQEYKIKVSRDTLTYDFDSLPSGFNKDNVSELTGAQILDSSFKVNADEPEKLTYKYKTRDNMYLDVTLNIEYITPPAVQVTINYDANGGKGEMSDEKVDKGSTYTLPKCTFTAPDNKKFDAWEVGGERKNTGDTITINDNITVKALWSTLDGEDQSYPKPEDKPTHHEHKIRHNDNISLRPVKPLKSYKEEDQIIMEIRLTIGSKILEKEINGMLSEIKMDTVPYIKGNRTMLPIRYIAEALGLEVDWIKETKTVILKDKDYRIEIPVKTNKIIVNGITYESDVEPEIKDNRTMLSIANVARSLGLKDGEDILWDELGQKVTIRRIINVRS